MGLHAKVVEQVPTTTKYISEGGQLFQQLSNRNLIVTVAHWPSLKLPRVIALPWSSGIQTSQQYLNCSADCNLASVLCTRRCTSWLA